MTATNVAPTALRDPLAVISPLATYLISVIAVNDETSFELVAQRVHRTVATSLLGALGAHDDFVRQDAMAPSTDPLEALIRFACDLGGPAAALATTAEGLIDAHDRFVA